LLPRNAPFLRRIGGRGLNGHRSMWIGQMSSGIRFYGVMRPGHSQENIPALRLLARLVRKNNQIVWFLVTNEK